MAWAESIMGSALLFGDAGEERSECLLKKTKKSGIFA